MRGLKQAKVSKIKAVNLSHLLQMRGLKRYAVQYSILHFVVASFTDAWIETLPIEALLNATYVASFTDAWIETAWNGLGMSVQQVASFTDAWIETRL